MTTADKLRRALVLRGWTETHLAERSGVHLNTISRALHGRRLGLRAMGRITQAFAAAPVSDGQRAALEELL